MYHWYIIKKIHGITRLPSRQVHGLRNALWVQWVTCEIPLKSLIKMQDPMHCRFYTEHDIKGMFVFRAIHLRCFGAYRLCTSWYCLHDQHPCGEHQDHTVRHFAQLRINTIMSYRPLAMHVCVRIALGPKGVSCTSGLRARDDAGSAGGCLWKGCHTT